MYWRRCGAGCAGVWVGWTGWHLLLWTCSCQEKNSKRSLHMKWCGLSHHLQDKQVLSGVISLCITINITILPILHHNLPKSTISDICLELGLPPTSRYYNWWWEYFKLMATTFRRIQELQADNELFLANLERLQLFQASNVAITKQVPVLLIFSVQGTKRSCIALSPRQS